jgi:hypothetical protein
MMSRSTSSNSAGLLSICHAQAAGGFVDQVDGLVRQEAVADVTMAERGRGDNRASVMRTP